MPWRLTPSRPTAPAGKASSTQTTAAAAALVTVTVTAVAVVWFPARSRATAESVCGPLALVVVFQAVLKGAARTSAPRLAPSSLNWTPTTPMLSEALAETLTAEPETVALLAGALMETVGGVVSAPPWLMPLLTLQKRPWLALV